MPTKKDTSLCYIRLFNAFTSSIAFDLYLDNQLMYSYFLYEDFTKYYPIPSGKHILKLTQHHKEDVLYEKKINLQRFQIYTGVLACKYKDPETYHIFCLEEPQKLLEPPRLAVRLNHFARFDGATSLNLSEEPLPIRNIRYGQASSYLVKEPAPYTFIIKETSEENELTTLSSKKLKPGRLYSIYLVGDGTKTFPYKPVLSIDGFSYLPIEKIQKRTT